MYTYVYMYTYIYICIYITWDQSIPQGSNKQIILQYAPRQKHWLYSSRVTYMYVYIYWPHTNALGNDCMGPSAINTVLNRNITVIAWLYIRCTHAANEQFPES